MMETDGNENRRPVRELLFAKIRYNGGKTGLQ
jgi:hypothetical protein